VHPAGVHGMLKSLRKMKAADRQGGTCEMQQVQQLWIREARRWRLGTRGWERHGRRLVVSAQQ
jgi:hypothetical protein